MRSGTSSSAGSTKGRLTLFSTTSSSRRRQRTPPSTVLVRWIRRPNASLSTLLTPIRRLLSSASSSLPNSNARSYPQTTRRSTRSPRSRSIIHPSEFSTHRLRSSTPSSIRSHRRTPTTWLSSSMQPVSTHRSSSRRWKLQTFHITVVLASPTIRHTERSYNFSDTHTLVEILVWVTSDHYSSSSDWWWISSMTRNDSVISMCPKSSGCSNSAQTSKLIPSPRH